MASEPIQMEWPLGEAEAEVSFIAKKDKQRERREKNGFDAWLERFDWRTSKATPGKTWATIQHQWRVVIRNHNDNWIATVYRGPGFGMYCSPEYDSVRDAQADAWLYALRHDDELLNDEFPVCIGCGGQDFEGDVEGFVCKRGCHAPMLGSFPACQRCGEDVIATGTTLCNSCELTLNWYD